MKGISLPVNAVVVIGLAVLVLVAVAAFFTLGAGRQLSEIEAQRIFSTGCVNICSQSAEKNYITASRLPLQYQSFYAACQRLYNVGEYPNRCLENCNCDMEVTQAEIQRNNERLEQLLGD